MKTFILVMALAIFILAGGTAFASSYGSDCYSFGNFNANIGFDTGITFKPFWTGNIVSGSSLGSLSGNLGFEYKPLAPAYTFSKTSWGRDELGIDYAFRMPQPRFGHFDVPEFGYDVALKEIPRANVQFKPIAIPLKSMGFRWECDPACCC